MSADALAGRRAIVTGGLGFIGSHLAAALVDRGAEVTIVDSLIPEYGGNPFNVREIADRLGATNAGQRAGAIELALEGLYLSRRLSKETGDGAAVYG